MQKIRLQRFGKRNRPTYRLVVVDSRFAPQSGKVTETLGWLDPRSKESSIKGERVTHWLSQGAQASDSAHNLLVRNKIISAAKRKLTGRKGIHDTGEKPAEEAPTEAAPETPAESAPSTEAEAETPAEAAPEEPTEAASETPEESASEEEKKEA